jgi:hypothetical protein
VDINPDVKPLDVASFKLTPKYLLHEANRVSKQAPKLSLLEMFKLERLNELQA